MRRFLLIGYYGRRVSWGSALYTIIVNRCGDFGFVLVLVFFVNLGIFNNLGVFIICLSVSLLLLSKRAIYPFNGWLPLAIAAPTPVSALVHSSTLVIAGLYMCSVLYNCLYGNSTILLVYLCLITMCIAGFSTLGESDMKKVVALSTSMHLGIMGIILFLLGILQIEAHIFFHAIYKRSIFIIVGVLICVACHEQDLRGVKVSRGSGVSV